MMNIEQNRGYSEKHKQPRCMVYL